jgi:hypothetical protein
MGIIARRDIVHYSRFTHRKNTRIIFPETSGIIKTKSRKKKEKLEYARPQQSTYRHSSQLSDNPQERKEQDEWRIEELGTLFPPSRDRL